MSRKTIFGCMGQTLRVDLTEKKAWKEELDEATYKKYIGGVALVLNTSMRRFHPALSGPLQKIG